MKTLSRRGFALAAMVGVSACAGGGITADDSSRRAALNSEGRASLAALYEEHQDARAVAEQAKGVLVFPTIAKGGLVGVSAETGDGVLFVDGQPADYYNVSSAGFGFALGVQAYSQAIMFMTDEALSDFRNSSGWEAGVDGSVTVATAGANVEVDSSNIQSPIVAYVYGETGLMANASIEGSKYTKLDL